MPEPLSSLAQKLIRWYQKNKRPLPWRTSRDPYKIWVSEVMLQQTQVQTVIPYYKKFIRRFPTIRHLARASETHVLKLWEGLGYYARARNLRKGAQFIVKNFRGQVPSHYSELLTLPGIGSYMAGAIASIAFDQPVPILEGNVKRIAARILGISQPIDLPKTLKKLYDAVAKWLPEKDAGDLNQALMELGQVICTPRNPNCSLCPIKDDCRAQTLRIQNDLPVRLPKKTRPTRHHFAWLVSRNGRYLIERRPSHGLLGGLWQIPIRESRPPRGIPLGTVQKDYSHFTEIIKIFRTDQVPTPVDSRTAWVSHPKLNHYPQTGASHKILEKIRQG